MKKNSRLFSFEGALFEVNPDSYFSQHEIVFQSPSRVWSDGFPLGNGNLGAMLYEPGCLQWGITKLDVWDRRSAKKEQLTSHSKIIQLLKKKDWHTLEQLRAKERYPWGSFPYSCPKPCGFLKIKSENDSNLFRERDKSLNFEKRLSLYNAAAYSNLRTDVLKTNVLSFINADTNVLVIKYSDKTKKTDGLLIELYRDTDASFALAPISGFDGKYFWIDYTFPDGFRYVMAAAVKGGSHQMEIGYPNYLDCSCTGYAKVKAKIKSSKSKEFTIFVSVATNAETKNPLKRAKELIDKAIYNGEDNLFEDHKKWWHFFWSKSFINLSDKLIENLWYFHLYQLASTSRSEPAPGLAGLWNMYDNPLCHGSYTDLNEPMIYYPIFTSNHIELGTPYYETFYKMLPTVKKETKQLYNLEGAKYPHQMGPDGEELGYTFIRYAQSDSALYAQVYWWHYLYTQDKKFLKERAYPVMKECALYYRGYLKKDTQGKYYVYPSYSLEQGRPWVKNVTMDLAMIKMLLKGTIQASKILKADKILRQDWEKIINNLADYPSRRGVFTDYEGIEPEDHIINHGGPIAVIFPSGEIGIGISRYKKAKKTFEIACEITSPSLGFAWSWLACAASRLGLGERAKEIIYGSLLSNFLKFNGFFGFQFPENQCRYVRSSERYVVGAEEDLIQLEAGSSFVTAINEMLLQSYNGIIRVFPALPNNWDVKIGNLRAVGAFLVSSEIKDNQVKYISIKSLAGERCNIINPWKNQELRVRDLTMGKVIITSKKAVVSFNTIKNHVYVIDRTVKPWESLPKSLLADKKRVKPREFKKREDCGGREKYNIYLGKPTQAILEKH